jgi:hypothetical protein
MDLARMLKEFDGHESTGGESPNNGTLAISCSSFVWFLSSLFALDDFRMENGLHRLLPAAFNATRRCAWQALTTTF